MKNVYCTECNKSVKGSTVKKKETFKVKGEDIVVTSSVLHCGNCKNEIFDEELDETNLLAAYNGYRSKHDLLSPTKIKEIRENYGLSQRSLGRLLQWGEITINRYESGGIQDAVHNEVLEFIENPTNMKMLFDKNKRFLPLLAREKLKKRIETLIDSRGKLSSYLDEYLLSNQDVDEYSGYKEFDWEKMEQMIIYLIGTLGRVYKTAINKYLWYMDFLSFKEHTVSISGSNYVHLPYGPVPNGYEFILGSMLSKSIDKEEIEFTNDIVGELYTAKAESNLSNFTDEEINIMDYVINRFRDYTATELSKYSHKEKAYKTTEEGEKISYKLSRGLSLSLS